jgi:hypothetical protein
LLEINHNLKHVESHNKSTIDHGFIEYWEGMNHKNQDILTIELKKSTTLIEYAIQIDIKVYSLASSPRGISLRNYDKFLLYNII